MIQKWIDKQLAPFTAADLIAEFKLKKGNVLEALSGCTYYQRIYPANRVMYWNKELPKSHILAKNYYTSMRILCRYEKGDWIQPETELEKSLLRHMCHEGWLTKKRIPTGRTIYIKAIK